MTPAEDTGLGLFDDNASAAGNFPGALRGYDRESVDSYVRTLEASVVQSRRHAASLEQQITGLQDQLEQSQAREVNPDDVDYADLGGRANDILRLAQEQANDLTNSANVAAERIREGARREAEALRNRAELESENLRAGGLAEVTELRDRLQQQHHADRRADGQRRPAGRPDHRSAGPAHRRRKSRRGG